LAVPNYDPIKRGLKQGGRKNLASSRPSKGKTSKEKFWVKTEVAGTSS